ncbi:DUF6339 family protein [Actinoplanes sp. NPDC048967]|uniref:DUF6339 family protein n=1 Tax=Actinoplanes sp. NPDC048967 TaxID=3155269 RepID=UPI0033CB7565
MSVLYPRLPDKAAKGLYAEMVDLRPSDLINRVETSHLAQYFSPTGGTRVTVEGLLNIRGLIRDIAAEFGFPDETVGRRLNRFDIGIAQALHTHMGLVPAEAAVRPMWAFLAVVLLPDVAVWRFPRPPGDRVLATDITRHVFGRLWWRAELLRDSTRSDDPYHLLDVFSERNFDQILARRRSIGGSPDLVRALAKEWPRIWMGTNETEVLRDTLKHLMRRGAFQDLFGLPEHLLRPEIAIAISTAKAARSERS